MICFRTDLTRRSLDRECGLNSEYNDDSGQPQILRGLEWYLNNSNVYFFKLNSARYMESSEMRKCRIERIIVCSKWKQRTIKRKDGF